MRDKRRAVERLRNREKAKKEKQEERKKAVGLFLCPHPFFFCGGRTVRDTIAFRPKFTQRFGP